MIIVWGSGLYGDVDAVPGIGNVATKFGHIYYLPLIPTGSHFVFETTADGWRGVPITMSFKSILTAWLRTVLGFMALGAMIVTAIEFAENRISGAIGGSVATVALIAMFVATKRMKLFTTASYERAKELATTIGLNDHGLVLIDLHYGEITEDEAQQQWEKIESNSDN